MSNWGTSSGLLDEYVGTVEEAEFATDVNYNNGETPQLRLKFVNIENDEGVNVDELTERWGVGKGYEVVDGGAAVEREDGNKQKKFHRRTKYGMVIDTIVKNPDGKLDGLLEALAERGDPNEAKVWKGLRIRWERIEVEGGPEIGTYDVLIPKEFIGAEPLSTLTTTNGTNGDLREEVLRVAKEADNYEAFVSRALGIPGVTSDQTLVKEISNEESGIFASV